MGTRTANRLSCENLDIAQAYDISLIEFKENKIIINLSSRNFFEIRNVKFDKKEAHTCKSKIECTFYFDPSDTRILNIMENSGFVEGVSSDDIDITNNMSLSSTGWTGSSDNATCDNKVAKMSFKLVKSNDETKVMLKVTCELSMYVNQKFSPKASNKAWNNRVQYTYYTNISKIILSASNNKLSAIIS